MSKFAHRNVNGAHKSGWKRRECWENEERSRRRGKRRENATGETLTVKPMKADRGGRASQLPSLGFEQNIFLPGCWVGHEDWTSSPDWLTNSPLLKHTCAERGMRRAARPSDCPWWMCWEELHLAFTSGNEQRAASLYSWLQPYSFLRWIFFWSVIYDSGQSSLKSQWTFFRGVSWRGVVSKVLRTLFLQRRFSASVGSAAERSDDNIPDKANSNQSHFI